MGSFGAWTRPLRLLVAEDNLVNQRVIAAFLAQAAVELTFVDDGEAALEALDERVFDIVLMDVQMPRLDGIEATRRLRAGVGPNRRIRVVALTANALDEQVETYFACGMDAFVPKPVDARVLVETIERFAPAEIRTPDARSEVA